MTGLIRLLMRAAVIGGFAYAVRSKLVDALTKTTGTWVGTPDAPR